MVGEGSGNGLHLRDPGQYFSCAANVRRMGQERHNFVNRCFASLCKSAGCIVDLETQVRNLAVESGVYVEAHPHRLSLPPDPPARQGAEEAMNVPTLEEAVARQTPYSARLARVCAQHLEHDSRVDARLIGPAFPRPCGTDHTVRSPCTATAIGGFINAVFGRIPHASPWTFPSAGFLRKQEESKWKHYHGLVVAAARAGLPRVMWR